MKNTSRKRLLLTALVASSFCAFLLWAIAQSDFEGLATISEPIKNPQKNAFINLNQPKAESILTNPAIISGKTHLAGTSLKVRIKDLKQMTLAESQLLAPNNQDSSPFSIKLKYKKATTKRGFVEVFQITKDGLEANKLIIPVTFAD